MDGIKRLIQNEPVMLMGLVQSAIAVGTAFGLGWTAEQVALVLAFTQTLLSVIARSMVTPTATVDAMVDQGVEDALTAEAEPMSDEQRRVLADLKEIRDRLREREQATR